MTSRSQKISVKGAEKVKKDKKSKKKEMFNVTE